jgi:hypothetical protein
MGCGRSSAAPDEVMPMKTLTTTLLALVLSLSAFNVLACSGEKAKDGKGEMSTPAKPKS